MTYITPDNDSNRNEIFRLRDVDDYCGYIEGDYEVSLGKIIKTLILAQESYIVYLDTDGYVEWTVNNKYEDGDNLINKFSAIFNKIGYIEEISETIADINEKFAVRRLLGESVARILKEQDEKEAAEILNTIEQLLKSRNRKIIIVNALITTCIIVVLELIIWLIYKSYQTQFHEWFKRLIELSICSLAGGIGGFVFLMIRSKTLEVEPSLSAKMYKQEGILRVIYGVIGAFIVYLALNTKLIFGNIDNPSFSIITFLICLIGGVSEKIIPSIIEKIEEKF